MRQTTKHTTQLFLVLRLLSLFLLPACGGGQPTENTGTPNADHLVKFNEEGIAMLRGYLSSGSFAAPPNGPRTSSIELGLPAEVEGMAAGVLIPLSVPDETEISSSVILPTTLRKYLIFHPGDTLFSAFPGDRWVEVTFVKKGTAFETLSIKEAREPLSLFQKKARLDQAFAPAPDGLSDGLLIGSIREAYKGPDGVPISWTFAIPVTIHKVIGFAIVQVHSAPDTQVFNSQGAVSLTEKFSWQFVQIQFTRQGDMLTARQITAVP